MKNEISYFKLFITFFKLGAFCFGGGYAMIPLIEREVCENKKWIEKEKLNDVFAIAGALPGAIGLNSSAFVGYTVGGIPGAIVALVGNIVPSVIIMIILITSFLQVKDSIYVQSAFNGIRPAVVALITYAAVQMAKSSAKDSASKIFFFGSICVCLIPGMSIIPVIAVSAALGVIIKIIQRRWLKNV